MYLFLTTFSNKYNQSINIYIYTRIGICSIFICMYLIIIYILYRHLESRLYKIWFYIQYLYQDDVPTSICFFIMKNCINIFNLVANAISVDICITK